MCVWKVRLKFLPTDDKDNNNNISDEDDTGALKIVLWTFMFQRTKNGAYRNNKFKDFFKVIFKFLIKMLTDTKIEGKHLIN